MTRVVFNHETTNFLTGMSASGVRNSCTNLH